MTQCREFRTAPLRLTVSINNSGNCQNNPKIPASTKSIKGSKNSGWHRSKITLFDAKYGKNVFSKSSPILIWAKTIDEGNETNKNLSQNRSTILILLSQTDSMIWRSAKSFGHPAATRPDAKYFGIQCLLGWVKITGVGLIWRFYSTATKRSWLHGQKLKKK